VENFATIFLWYTRSQEIFFAKDWSAGVCTEYGFKPGIAYDGKIEQRLMEEEILQQQLGTN
jgi:hypothetical protein